MKAQNSEDDILKTIYIQLTRLRNAKFQLAHTDAGLFMDLPNEYVDFMERLRNPSTARTMVYNFTFVLLNFCDVLIRKLNIKEDGEVEINTQKDSLLQKLNREENQLDAAFSNELDTFFKSLKPFFKAFLIGNDHPVNDEIIGMIFCASLTLNLGLEKEVLAKYFGPKPQSENQFVHRYINSLLDKDSDSSFKLSGSIEFSNHLRNFIQKSIEGFADSGEMIDFIEKEWKPFIKSLHNQYEQLRYEEADEKIAITKMKERVNFFSGKLAEKSGEFLVNHLKIPEDVAKIVTSEYLSLSNNAVVTHVRNAETIKPLLEAKISAAEQPLLTGDNAEGEMFNGISFGFIESDAKRSLLTAGDIEDVKSAKVDMLNVFGFSESYAISNVLLNPTISCIKHGNPDDHSLTEVAKCYKHTILHTPIVVNNIISYGSIKITEFAFKAAGYMVGGSPVAIVTSTLLSTALKQTIFDENDSWKEAMFKAAQSASMKIVFSAAINVAWLYGNNKFKLMPDSIVEFTHKHSVLSGVAASVLPGQIVELAGDIKNYLISSPEESEL